MGRALADTTDYQPPAGQVGLTGPVTRPAPGTLPLRGDLAHLALAGRFLVPHYAVPRARAVGPEGAPLHLAADGSSDTLAQLAGRASLPCGSEYIVSLCPTPAVQKSLLSSGLPILSFAFASGCSKQDATLK